MDAHGELDELGLPDGLGKPAERALPAAGIQTLGDVLRSTEKELLALHGVGPRAIRLLRTALAEHGAALD